MSNTLSAELQVLKKTFDLTPIHHGYVDEAHSSTGQKEFFEVEVLLSQEIRRDPATGSEIHIFKLQFSRHESNGKTPEMPKLKSGINLPHHTFLTQGRSAYMITPQDVLDHIQMLQEGFGIFIDLNK